MATVGKFCASEENYAQSIIHPSTFSGSDALGAVLQHCKA